MSALKLSLDREDFEHLVRGGELAVNDVNGDPVASIILKDIGYVAMKKCCTYSRIQ